MAPTPRAAARTLPPDVSILARALADTPYDRLFDAIRDAGWTWHLSERDVSATPHGTLAVFDLVVSDGETSGTLQRVTAHLPPNIGAVSLGARLTLQQTVLYLLTDRLPPREEAAPAAPRAPVEADMERIDVDVGDGDGDPAEDAKIPWQEPAPAALDVVARRTPDGLPVFRDLYTLGAPSAGIVAAAMAEIEQALDLITAQPQLDALHNLNTEAVEFIKDLGTPADLERLKTLIARKRGLLSGGFTAPRRRSAA